MNALDPIHHLLRRLGLRLMRAKNCPRGTDIKLYSDVLAQTQQNGLPFTVLDVGANHGEFSSEILRSVPEARVHAFEPSPAVFTLLMSAHKLDTRVTCHQLALGTLQGSLPFEPRPDDDKLGRLLHNTSPTAIHVDVTTVDAVLDKLGITHVALLKTDTEGHELDVLRGAAGSLQEGRISSILVESTLGPSTDRHISLSAISEELQPLGFELFGVYDMGYDRHTGAMRFCNALFKHASVSDAFH